MSEENIVATARRIGLRLAEASREELLARYDLGRLAHEVRYSRGEYGGRAQETLARLVRLDESVLRRHARVTETIHGPEFDAFLQLRTPAGAPLTWSHLEVLSAVRVPGKRWALAQAAAAEGLSVRALRSRTCALCP